MTSKPVTPLRRSERLRRPTAKAIGSSLDSSPGTAAYVNRSTNPRSRVFSSPSGQTDSDSTLLNSSSSKSSGSCTEDTVGDATDSMALVSRFSPKLYQTYQGLAPMLRYSNAELIKRDIPMLDAHLKELNPFLRSVVGTGYSRQWPEFEKFMELYNRIAKVIDAKKAALSPKMQQGGEIDFVRMRNGFDFAAGSSWVAMKGEHSQEAWKDTADPEYLRGLYRDAAPPNNFDWNDVGAGSSGVQPVTDALDYSLSYPPAKTLDYCTIPNTY